MNTVLIIMGVALALILIIGIYRAATSNLREKPSLKPNSDVNRGNTIKVLLAIIGSIALIVAMFAAYSYFVAQ